LSRLLVYLYLYLYLFDDCDLVAIDGYV